MPDKGSNFSEPEELQLLADSVATLLDRAGGRGRARKMRGCRNGVDRIVWSELADAGMLGAMTSEDAGGLGAGLAAGGTIAREFGRALAPEPFCTAIGLSAGLIERLDPGHELLAEIISGKTIAALAFAERGQSGPLAEIRTRYSGGKLAGDKAWVANVEGAEAILVIANTPDGLALCRVEGAAPAMTLNARRQADGSDLHDIAFSDTPAEAVAAGPEVEKALRDAIDDATALAAAELLGVAAEALELTIEFLKTREQFGKPIGSFQALKHRAVDMHIHYEIAAAGIEKSLSLMDETTDGQLRSAHASRAKSRAGEAARLITREAIQLHGAVGYTDEFDIGLYLNRALTLSAWLGDAKTHRARWLKLRHDHEALT